MGSPRKPKSTKSGRRRRTTAPVSAAGTEVQPGPEGLPEWQERFCWRYASTLNATRAYMAERENVKANAAATEAWKLLKEPEIMARVTAIQAELRAAVQVEAQDIVRELKRIGFARLSDAVEWTASGVNLKPSADLDDDTLAAVAEVSREVTEFGTRMRVKMHDKGPALVNLGKTLGMFTEKIDLTITDGLAARLKAARERAKRED